MFKNTVFSSEVNTKTWLINAGIRAVKTFAQTMVSGITVGAAFSEVNWVYVLSCSGVAFILSILTSVAGIPEVKSNTE